MVDDPARSRVTLATALGLPVDRVAAAPVPGRVHDHWRVETAAGLRLVRVPKLSHLGLDPRAALAYEAQAFRRAADGGSTPRLHAILRVRPGLPRGAMVVDAVDGRAPHLPDDLPALGRALAGVHGLPLPPPARRRPLLDPEDPVGYLIGVVRDQLAPVRDRLAAPVARLLETEVDAAVAAMPARRPMPALVLADTHPGNFLVRDDGVAVMVDVERPLYDSPAVDLAHACLPTSLRWDPAVTGSAGRADIVRFHNAWAAAVPAALADAVRACILPYRRLVWLRTTSWACAWAARNDLAAALHSAEPATAGVARRLARFVDPAMMEAARQQWAGAEAFNAEELVP